MNRRIQHGFAQLSRLAERVALLQEIIMATLADLQAKITELEQVVTDDEAQDDATVAALNQTIADLQAAPFDTQPFIDSLEAIKGKVHSSQP